jgi:hypothetical protein
MKQLKQLLAVTLLVLTISLSAYAGDMSTPGFTDPPPPPPGDMSTPGCVTTAPGDMETPGATANQMSLTDEVVYDLLVGMLSIF